MPVTFNSVSKCCHFPHKLLCAARIRLRFLTKPSSLLPVTEVTIFQPFVDYLNRKEHLNRTLVPILQRVEKDNQSFQLRYKCNLNFKADCRLHNCLDRFLQARCIILNQQILQILRTFLKRKLLAFSELVFAIFTPIMLVVYEAQKNTTQKPIITSAG